MTGRRKPSGALRSTLTADQADEKTMTTLLICILPLLGQALALAPAPTFASPPPGPTSAAAPAEASLAEPIDAWSFRSDEHDYVWVFVAAFIVTFAATPILRWIALKNNVIDEPDLKRKMHLEPIAYLGGVGIFLGWLVGVVICLVAVGGGPGEALRVHFPIYIILGAAIITVIGVIDDVYGVSPRVKIGGQLIAAAALASETAIIGQGSPTQQEVMLGAKLVTDTVNILGGTIPYDLAYIIGTGVIALLVLGGCNALNLIDGLDGLAAGVTAIATAGFLAIAITLSVTGGGPDSPQAWFDPVRIVLCMALLGALLGFLPYNFNPANIFMGDAGSLLLGYLCVAIILQFERIGVKGPVFVLAGLIVLAMPIIDTALAIVRRKLRGQPIFSPDKQHIHHQVLHAFERTGVSRPAAVKLSVLSIYGLCVLFALLGWSLVFLKSRYVLAAFLVVFGTVAVFAYKTGHQQLLREQLRQKQDASRTAQPPTPDQLDAASHDAPSGPTTSSTPTATPSPDEKSASTPAAEHDNQTARETTSPTTSPTTSA